MDVQGTKLGVEIFLPLEQHCLETQSPREGTGKTEEHGAKDETGPGCCFLVDGLPETSSWLRFPGALVHARISLENSIQRGPGELLRQPETGTVEDHLNENGVEQKLANIQLSLTEGEEEETMKVDPYVTMNRSDYETDQGGIVNAYNNKKILCKSFICIDDEVFRTKC